MSLSARRAWIEISIEDLEPSTTRVVALRKESVDRNISSQTGLMGLNSSLSARRAWIEIHTFPLPRSGTASRSPQGERG